MTEQIVDLIESGLPGPQGPQGERADWMSDWPPLDRAAVNLIDPRLIEKNWGFAEPIGKRIDPVSGSHINFQSVRGVVQVHKGDVVRRSSSKVIIRVYDKDYLLLGLMRNTDPALEWTVDLEGAQWMTITASMDDTLFEYRMVSINQPLPSAAAGFGMDAWIGERIGPIESVLSADSPNLLDPSIMAEGGTWTSPLRVVTAANGLRATRVWIVSPGDVVRCSRPWSTINVYNAARQGLVSWYDGKPEHTVPADGCYLTWHVNDSQGVEHAWSTYGSTMLTINAALPAAYMPGPDRLGRLDHAVRQLAPTVATGVVLLDFDGPLVEDDLRIDLMDEYGWRPTIVAGLTSAGTTRLDERAVRRGWNFSLYQNFPDNLESLIDSTSSDAARRFDEWVGQVVAQGERIGLYDATQWSSQHNSWGRALRSALLKQPSIRVMRSKLRSATPQVLSPWQIDGSQAVGVWALEAYNTADMDSVTATLDRVADCGGVIDLMTHWVTTPDMVKEDDGAYWHDDTWDYNLTEVKFRQVADHLKQLEQDGRIRVMNSEDWWAATHPVDAAAIRLRRLTRLINAQQGE